MTSGVRIYNKNAVDPTIPVLDITSRCLNTLGFIDTGVWFGLNSWYHKPSELKSYNDDDIFMTREIEVPELSYGEPFYNVSDKLYKLIIGDNHLLFQKWLKANIPAMQSDQRIKLLASRRESSCFYSHITPDVSISGNKIIYQYRKSWIDNILGDYSYILMGGIRITYGVL